MTFLCGFSCVELSLWFEEKRSKKKAEKTAHVGAPFAMRHKSIGSFQQLYGALWSSLLL